MIKLHSKSKIILTHHNSVFTHSNMSVDADNKYIILQVEELKNEQYDLLIEVVLKTEFE